MKKVLLSLLTMVSILAFSSCSSNDEPEVENNALAVAGSYTGYTNSSASYFSDLFGENQTVTITANEDGTANVTLNTTVTAPAQMNNAKINATMIIENATVTPVANSYTITGKGVAEIAGYGAGAKSYDCNLSATISSNKDNADLVFTLPSVMGGMKINFIQGEAPANLAAAGEYEGYSLTSTAYFQSMLKTDEEVEVTANQDGTVKIEFDSDTWGKISIPASTATRESTNAIVITGNGKITMPGMDGAPAKTYDCSSAGSINSAKDNVTFTFIIPGIMGGTTIKFNLGAAPE